MKPLSADKSRIPKELRDHPEVLALEAEVLSQFADPEARKRTCVHEAAHEIYFHRLGIKTERRGPFAYYDEATQQAHFANASVCPVDCSQLKNNLTVYDWAKVFAAGYVAAKNLTPLGALEAAQGIEGTGSGSDFNKFVWFMRQGFENIADEQFKCAFDRAKVLVEVELRNPELQAEVWRVADEFGREIFGEGVSPSPREASR
jgi:hypothetical protein